MKIVKYLLITGLFLICLAQLLRLFSNSIKTSVDNEIKNNTKMFAIDSIIYRQPGADNTLQVTPYWKCHLKGTNVWVTVRNQKPGDSIAMIIKY
jgi:hypothetical protein